MSNIVVGQQFPEFEITKGGLTTASGAFEVWGTDELMGKATLVIANAGHASANDMHHHITSKIFDARSIRLCRIINAKDAPMGAGLFIKNEFKKGAKNDSENLYVMDSKGLIATELDMEKKSAVVSIIDAEGKVLFAHEGMLNPEHETEMLNIIETLN